MPDIVNSVEDIEDIFRSIVLNILQLDPSAEENQKRVRFPWGSNISKPSNDSAPAWKKDEDICVIYLLPQDDFYNRNRGRRYIDFGGRDLTAVEEYTGVHYVNFVNYGPNAYKCAREIRDGLFIDEIRRLLKQSNLALIPDVAALKRIPELFEGQWWNRVDFSAVFNEYVRRESLMPVIEQISINALEITSQGKEITKNENIERSYSDNG